MGSFYAFTVVYGYFDVSLAESGVIAAGRENPTLLLVLIPLSVLLVGPGEELFYRGVVQGWLRESFGPVGAIVAASVLFASIHVPGLVGSSGLAVLATLAIIGFLALYLGALYEYTGNLVVPALVHGLYNATQFALAYVQATGGA
nr:CPBP family intramembrane glutamic endopeptidase [Halomarina rubra]